MPRETRRVTGLKNVSETWDQNEQKRAAGGAPSEPGTENEDMASASELDRVIREEAAAYDLENNEERLLGGDRATRNDDDTTRL